MDAAVGARLLGDVEEESLQEVLKSLRTSFETDEAPKRVKVTHIPELDEIASRHFQSTKTATISITGRYLPLIYKIISTIVSEPHRMAVLVIDIQGRFDVTRLTCSNADLRHVYVQTTPRSSPDVLRSIVSQAEDFMLYSKDTRISSDREWWGTMVLGGLGAGDLVAGWKGWLRVDREAIRPFPPGISVEEALQQRDARNKAVQAAGWEVSSPWGGFIFHDGEPVA